MIKKSVLTIIFVLAFIGTSVGADVESIKLPAPNLTGGKTLMQALQARKSAREFSARKLSPEVLSSLLWAGWGINRPDIGRRTAPSAVNWQEIDVYVAMEEGLYLYNAKENTLKLFVMKDLRALTGKQPFVKDAPVNLIYVADYSRMGGCYPEERSFYSAADAAFISENVYLFCASEGLATVVRALLDRDDLAKAMQLRNNQKVVFAQSVGYPK